MLSIARFNLLNKDKRIYQIIDLLENIVFARLFWDF